MSENELHRSQRFKLTVLLTLTLMPEEIKSITGERSTNNPPKEERVIHLVQIHKKY